jgi:4-hydroxy-2-oxoglutarate aldolase
MSAPVLKGIFPPLVTPFLEDGALDLSAFEANLDRYLAFDLAGYLVLGSNGEAQALAEPEKVQLIEAARRRSAGRTILAGTGLESTQATVELTRKAADAGADAALVLTPHYYRAQMTSDVLRRHFETVAEASPIPVLLYTVPQFTGLPCPPGLPAALSAHPRIAGMKDSGGDAALLGRILASVPAAFAVLCGSAPILYPALSLGAAGGILAVACCAPRPAAALYRAVERGDHRTARRIQLSLTPLAAAVTSGLGVAGLKAAMDVAGFRGGAPRGPLQPVHPAARADIYPLLERAEAAVDGETLPS